MAKVGIHLRKLSQNKAGVPLLGHSVVCSAQAWSWCHRFYFGRGVLYRLGKLVFTRGLNSSEERSIIRWCRNILRCLLLIRTFIRQWRQHARHTETERNKQSDRQTD